MDKILVIAEKPNARNDMATALESIGEHFIKNDGYLESEHYILSNTIGHLTNLKKPNEINESLGTVWNEDTLKSLPYQIDISKDIKIIDEAYIWKQYKILQGLFKRTDIKYLVNGGDAGREGILIQERVYQMLHNKFDIKMLWASSLTKEALIKAFKNLKEKDKTFIDLLESAKARATIDWMYGMTYTTALTVKLGNGQKLTYGRCQTPLLNLLAKRENEIKNFKKEDYFEIQGTSNDITTIATTDTLETLKFKTEQEANIEIEKAKNDNFILESLEEKEIEKKPPLLMALPDLQTLIGKKYKFSPEKTLEIAQSLYEKHLITYPRTDSRYLTTDVANEYKIHLDGALNTIKQLKGFENLKITKNQVEKKYVNDGKVTDHHALIPTEESLELSKLEKSELIVYIEICKSFIALFMDNYKFEKKEAIFKNKEHNDITLNTLYAIGKKDIEKGFKALYQKMPGEDEDKVEITKDNAEDNEDELNTLNLTKADIGKNYKFTFKTLAKETKPPIRYGVSNIIALMKANKIGTPATMSTFIDKLKKAEFITEKKSKYYVTEQGMRYINILPEELKETTITSNMEDRLKDIEDGKYTYKQLIDDIYAEQKAELSKIYQIKNDGKTAPSKTPIVKCPLCGGKVYNNKGMYVCENQKYDPNTKETTGCKFKLWHKICEKELSDNQIKDLIEKGKIIVSGLKSKKGTKFEAILKYNKELNKIDMEFPKRR